MNETKKLIITFPTHDDYLTSLGSTSHYDAIFLFAFPPFGMLAFICNIVSFCVFSSRYFHKKPLYTYIRTCCLNSSIINIVFAVTFISESRRYLPSIVNTEFSSYFHCYFKIPVINMCYFYGSVLDILLSFDRLVEFTRFKATFRRLNPHRVCLVAFVTCVVINTPYMLVFEPKKRLDNFMAENGSIHVQISHLISESEFALSPHGSILKKTQYFIRDVLTLLIMVIFNVLTLILLRYLLK